MRRILRKIAKGSLKDLGIFPLSRPRGRNHNKGKTLISNVTRLILVIVLITGIFFPLPVLGSEPFNIGFDDWIGSAPFYLAAKKGFYQGVEVRFRRIASEDQRRADLASGHLQMMCETISMFQAGRNASDYIGKIIFALDESRGADGVVASNGIRSVVDLKGKTAAGQSGMPSHLVLIAALERNGIGSNELIFHDMPVQEAVTAFVSGKADALCAYEPHISSSLKSRPDAHLLLSGRDFPGLVVHVAVVKEDAISGRREDLEKIYEGWTKAVTYIRDHPAESAEIMAGAFGLSSDEVRELIAGFKFFGKEENEKFFGVANPCCPSDAAINFDWMSKALEKNGLTNAVSSGTQRIDFSIIGTVKMKRTSGTQQESGGTGNAKNGRINHEPLRPDRPDNPLYR